MPDPAGAPRERERVTEIVGTMPAFTKPTSFLELSGTVQMGLLLVVVCLVTLLMLVAWWSTRPTLQDVETLLKAAAGSSQQPLEPEKVAQTLGLLQRDHADQFRNVFQFAVMSGLVPLFTLMAGYVFGKGKTTAESGKQGDRPP